MPQIIVTADQGDGDVMLRERVNVADFESQHFAAQLVERLGWAVEDADQVERKAAVPPSRFSRTHNLGRAAGRPTSNAPRGAQPSASVVMTAS